MRNTLTLAAALFIASTLNAGVPEFQINDSTGIPHSSQEWQHRRAVVLLFLATDCAISNRYAPSINQLAKEFGSRNVGFYGVHSDPDVTPEEARKHARDFGFPFPMLLDPNQTLASRFDVMVTPTAVVVSPSGQLLYRGRIDDRSVDLGKWRDVARKQDLRDAIDATIAGRNIASPSPGAIGCFLPPPKRSK